MYEKKDVLGGQGHVALVDAMGSDKSILDAARVSYSKDTVGHDKALDERDKKLLYYLMKNRHTSPFESVILSFEVEAPIFIFRQWHRHRTWSYNEVSARYTELPDKFYAPDHTQIGVQHASNKQMRSTVALTEAQELDRKIEVAEYLGQCRTSYSTYEKLLKAGWPRELARMVLPVSTFSRMVATVDLHNLLHFLRLRLHEHAQWEIQQYALAMLHLAHNVAPVAIEAFLGDIMAGTGYAHLFPEGKELREAQ